MKRTILVFLITVFPFLLFSLELKSPAFKHKGKIPTIFTCDGKDISPELKITGIPQGTKSLVLIMDDPDAPMGTWVHWVIYNIPPSTHTLKRNFPKKDKLANGIEQGENSWGKIGYGGPCPPKNNGAHRYMFKLYAIDKKLSLAPGAREKEILLAIKHHILASAILIGTYERK